MIRIKHNKATYAMIKSAVEKGIYDIQDNPARGFRNLVELGEMFASGPLQKNFFTMARGELARENSAYYRLVERVVQNADPDFLTTFGVNLGYNCWTYGARFIRGVEAEHGFNIPWTFFIDMGEYGVPGLALVENVLNQGAEIGMYCAVFHFPGPYPDMEGLLELLAQKNDCAYLFLLEPQMVTDSLARRIAELKNILVAFDLEAGEREECRAVEILFRNGCIFGGFVRFDTLETASERLAEAYEKSLPLLIFLQRSVRDKEALERDRRVLLGLRTRLEHPVFPVDLFGDIAYLDRNISTEACLATLRGDGMLEVCNLDREQRVESKDIREHSLVEIFRQALPKAPEEKK